MKEKELQELQKEGLVVKTHTLTANQVIFIPVGWVVAEQVTQGKVVAGLTKSYFTKGEATARCLRMISEMEKSEDRIPSSERLAIIASMAAPAPIAIPEAVPAEEAATEVQEPQEAQDAADDGESLLVPAEDGEHAAAEHGEAEAVPAEEEEAQDEPPSTKARASDDSVELAPEAELDKHNSKVASSTRLGQKTSSASVGPKPRPKPRSENSSQ